MIKKAIFPGSFDPITKGHYSVIARALSLFDHITVAIGTNADKKYFYPLEIRKKMLEQTFKAHPNIKIDTYSGLTINYCKKNNIPFILRGLRTTMDFNFERPIAQINHEMENSIETVFLACQPQYSAISSSIVRDVLRNNGDVSKFIPETINWNDFS